MSHVDEGLLHAYIDAELTRDERTAVDAHLAQCAVCRTRLEEERALVERTKHLFGYARPQERPAPPLEQLRQRPRARRSPWELRMPVAWAASIALALSIGYYMRDMESPEAPVATIAATPSAPNPPPAPEPQRVNRAAPSRERAPSAETHTPAPVRDEPPGEQKILARSDTPTPEPPAAVTEGAVSRLQSRRQTRAAESAPRPAQAPVAPYMDERAANSDWPFISQDRARQLLGTAPVGIPALPIRGIRRDPTAEGNLVVEQELGGKTVIQIFQRKAETEKNEAANRRLARFVGPLRVEIAGPLPQDSLNRLLEQVQPLP
jgi:anti-sigma factor RsiW